MILKFNSEDIDRPEDINLTFSLPAVENVNQRIICKLQKIPPGKFSFNNSCHIACF